MVEILTLRLLRDGHAEPLQVQAVLAADARGSAAERMERDGSHYQWKLQTELRSPRNIHTNLRNQQYKRLEHIMTIYSHS